MLRSHREIKARLEREDWILDRVRGSHRVFRNPRTGPIIVLPHPRKDLGLGLVRAHLSTGGLAHEVGTDMRHYVAIVDDAGPDTAVGVWFPDLPGCFSAGETVENAMKSAPEAIELYRDALAESGRELPAPRTPAA